ncbi:MAG: hypothetical protein WAX02_01935 [Methanothrix sp.]
MLDRGFKRFFKKNIEGKPVLGGNEKPKIPVQQVAFPLAQEFGSGRVYFHDHSLHIESE